MGRASLDCAAGQPESHPHQRAGARPGDQFVGRGNEKALVRKLVVEGPERGIVGPNRSASADRGFPLAAA